MKVTQAHVVDISNINQIFSSVRSIDKTTKHDSILAMWEDIRRSDHLSQKENVIYDIATN